MGHKVLKDLYLEREKIMGNLSKGKNRAKMLVRLMDIDADLEKFTLLEKKELEQSRDRFIHSIYQGRN